MYALKDDQGNITHNMDETIKVAERFHTGCMPATLDRGKLLGVQTKIVMSPITKEEVGKALKGTKIVKAAGDEGLTMDLFKKTSALFTECLKTQKVTVAGKSAYIILIHKKGSSSSRSTGLPACPRLGISFLPRLY